MALDTSFLSSRVARRIFVLFIVCALVPITALAVISFGQVSAQLYEHGELLLESGVRSVGQGIVERLLLLEAELQFADRRYAEDVAVVALPDRQNPFASRRFLGLARLTDDGQEVLYGEPFEAPPIGAEESVHLDVGGTLLLTEAFPGQPPAIFLVRALNGLDGGAELIIASVDPAYLWAGGADTLPRNNHLCVFDQLSVPLFCTRPADGALPESVLETISGNTAGTLEWSLEGDDFLAAYWSMPLAYQFAVPRWTVMLSESTADLLAPMASFRRIFPFVILLSLWVVLLLSIGQIRRSLVPLEQLQAGTRRIGSGNFDSRVDVSSGDEFEELADSFNEMASRLGKQFKALETIAEIDRTILSSLNIEKIVRAVLHRTCDLFECRALSITLVSPDQQKVPRTYTLRSGAGNASWVETTFLDSRDFKRFEAEPDILEIGPQDGVPAFLATLARFGCRSFAVFPMFINNELAGAISLGFKNELSLDEDDRRQARQLSDQVAVALSNTHLVEDLDALNWGSLTALARTVDAKSPWTAGHSERVTAMGLKIGEFMKLGEDELDVLHRGGLLHDIGKIGVPAAIIDKPARLTKDEYDVMKKHPEIGANILQPIAAFADLIPIVRQHHERWDGSGYPDGLAENQIHPYARICAVADVYDAMISDRPYRPGMAIDEVIRTIVAGDGTEFESEVVAAFLGVMTEEGLGLLETEVAVKEESSSPAKR
ncbi:MAG: HD domain-containing protein [Acidobacteria bacterium]|nr:HD domain-containing protein [Acidobacteriota bacterium]